MIIKDRHITSPGDQNDGLCLWDGNEHTVENCLIDLSDCDLSDIDEAVSVTYGSSAVFRNCVIRGAGKLALCGCGDESIAPREFGKTVTFNHCILENFGRRGPEVQDGMRVYLVDCLIRNWGDPDRFTVRSFGAWAHGYQSMILANHCVFQQDNGKRGKHWFKDLIGHIGQAWNDRKLAGLFSKDVWRPGNCRALVASDGGLVVATRCFSSPDWVVLEERRDDISSDEAKKLVQELEEMRRKLYAKFGC